MLHHRHSQKYKIQKGLVVYSNKPSRGHSMAKTSTKKNKIIIWSTVAGVLLAALSLFYYSDFTAHSCLFSEIRSNGEAHAVVSSPASVEIISITNAEDLARLGERRAQLRFYWRYSGME
jgi:hypothetical protein